MTFVITISKHALKELEIIPKKHNVKICKAIDELANNPRPRGCKKLKGEEEYMWRIRIGIYRVLYVIEEKIKIIEVRKIGHRKDIYE